MAVRDGRFCRITRAELNRCIEVCGLLSSDMEVLDLATGSCVFMVSYGLSIPTCKHCPTRSSSGAQYVGWSKTSVSTCTIMMLIVSTRARSQVQLMHGHACASIIKTFNYFMTRLKRFWAIIILHSTIFGSEDIVDLISALYLRTDFMFSYYFTLDPAK